MRASDRVAARRGRCRQSRHGLAVLSLLGVAVLGISGCVSTSAGRDVDRHSTSPTGAAPPADPTSGGTSSRHTVTAPPLQATAAPTSIADADTDADRPHATTVGAAVPVAPGKSSALPAAGETASTAPSGPASSLPGAAASAISGLAAGLSGTYGNPVTITYTLISGGSQVPDASTTLGYRGQTVAVRLDGAGRGTARLSNLPVGDTPVTVGYAGDGSHRPTSATVTVSVARAPSQIRRLSTSGSTIEKGKPVTIAFDVVSAGRPVVGAGGTVRYAGATKSVALDANGHGTATLSGLPAGKNRVVVAYAGDPNRAAASAPITITVTDSATSTGAAATTGAAAPASPCPAAARACVDLTHNTTWLQSGGKVVYGPVPITSGRPGHRTPAGTFHVYWKDKNHKSSLFDGAPMPNSVFFVGGIAFHQGSLSVPSHGCIHLSWGASQTYWDSLRNGDEVSVFGFARY